MNGVPNRYEQALQVTEKEMGSNSPDTAAALNDLAIVVREVHEDQEALQLHARAIRIRQKNMGVWNVTVAEGLYNVSLIYHDLDDLPSAIQCARGCCRIYDAVLGATHADTRDAEEHLDQLSDEFRNGGALRPTAATGWDLGCGLFAKGRPAASAKEIEASHDLSANSRLRVAFRTVLEEVGRGVPPNVLAARGTAAGMSAALTSQPSRLSESLKAAENEAIRSWTAGIGAHAMQGNTTGLAIGSVYAEGDDKTALFRAQDEHRSEKQKAGAASRFAGSNSQGSTVGAGSEAPPDPAGDEGGALAGRQPLPPGMEGRTESFRRQSSSSSSSSFSSHSSATSAISAAMGRSQQRQQQAQGQAQVSQAPVGMGASAAQMKAISAFGGGGGGAQQSGRPPAPAPLEPAAGAPPSAAQKKALAAFGGGGKKNPFK